MFLRTYGLITATLRVSQHTLTIATVKVIAKVVQQLPVSPGLIGLLSNRVIFSITWEQRSTGRQTRPLSQGSGTWTTVPTMPVSFKGSFRTFLEPSLHDISMLCIIHIKLFSDFNYPYNNNYNFNKEPNSRQYSIYYLWSIIEIWS